VNVIVALKAQFITRDVALTREQLDAKQFKPFWELATHKFLSNDPELDTMHGNAGYFANLGLSSRYSGYPITPAKAEQMFKDLRSDHMKAQGRFRKSGNGEGGSVDALTSVVVFSSVFSDFVRGFPAHEYFYDALIKHQLLQSAATDLPPNAASSSSAPGSSTMTSRTRMSMSSASPGSSSSSSSSSASATPTTPLPASELVNGGKRDKDKGGLKLSGGILDAIREAGSSPLTKAAESQTSKNMAKKTKLGLKRQRLSFYNELTATVKSKQVALSEIADPAERADEEAVLVKIKKKLKKAEAEALADSDSDGE
jgi:hypothetical protein